MAYTTVDGSFIFIPTQRVHSQGILVECEWRGDGDRSNRGRTRLLQADFSFLIRLDPPFVELHALSSSRGME